MVASLTPETILDSKEQDMSVDLSKLLKDQDPDITFMQFRLDAGCHAVNYWITTAGPLSTHFSIRLPHHLFDSSDNSVTLINPVVSVYNMPI